MDLLMQNLLTRADAVAVGSQLLDAAENDLGRAERITTMFDPSVTLTVMLVLLAEQRKRIAQLENTPPVWRAAPKGEAA